MSKQREALQMALQALEEIAAHYPADWEFDICVYAKNLLREALAEPSRKPLTDEEIQEMRYSLDFPCGKHPFINIVKAVERAHGVGGGE